MTTFYIGTYTTGTSRGLYRARLDSNSGEIGGLELVAELDNPAFFGLHPSLPLLVACSEVRRNGQRQGARLVAYRIQPNRDLTLLNAQPTGGQGPCYVSVNEQGTVALVAHYASGSVVSLPLDSNGQIEPVTQLVQHVGQGPRADRQEGPHAHCIVPAPDSTCACAVDLGIDQVLVYDVNETTRALSAQPVSIYHAPPGSGPRHLTFHPNGRFAFLIHELGNTLTVLSWNPEQKCLTETDAISTLPADFRGESITAEVLVHPGGQFVYGSNRGHDSLIACQFDATSGKLQPLQHISTGGKTPRNFRLDPSGQFLLAANQDSDSIIVFRIDSKTGRLTATGHTLSVGQPSCVKFFD